ncbi:hypothetical protein C8J57DRAFT_1232354 [Mycena rebaudengoi]|nr:hypothetical protein C8J57DRAFT_1232354 [Mycena rebaudengoi]
MKKTAAGAALDEQRRRTRHRARLPALNKFRQIIHSPGNSGVVGCQHASSFCSSTSAESRMWTAPALSVEQATPVRLGVARCSSSLRFALGGHSQASIGSETKLSRSHPVQSKTADMRIHIPAAPHIHSIHESSRRDAEPGSTPGRIAIVYVSRVLTLLHDNSTIIIGKHDKKLEKAGPFRVYHPDAFCYASNEELNRNIHSTPALHASSHW